MTRLILTRAARGDLASIWTYTARAWGKDQAEAYVTALHRDMQRLVDFPQSGTPHHSRYGAFRKVPSGHHIVFYQLEAAGVLVVRVLHERMDVNAKL